MCKFVHFGFARQFNCTKKIVMKKPAKFNFAPLFNLVKSLSMSERIYFKKFTSANTSKDDKESVMLFNALEGMNVFDQQKIKAVFIEENLVAKINLTGFYLNYQLMGILRSYHSTISIGAELKDSLRDMELLYNKGHYVQCKKLLEKAKKKASHYERLDRVIELLEWERKLVSKDIGIEHQEKFMRKIYDELGEVLEKKLNRYQFEHCFTIKYSMIKRYNIFRSESDYKRWKKLTDTSIFLKGGKPLTPTAEIYHHFINSMDYFVKGNMHKVFSIVQNRFEALEKMPDIIKDSPHQYITVLSNIASLRASLSIIGTTNYKENKKIFFNTLNIIKKIDANTTELETRIFANISIHEIGFHINTGDFIIASNLSEHWEKEMIKRNIKLGKCSELSFLYYSSYAHFASGKHFLAHQSINQLLKSNYSETRIDMQCYAMILNLMLLFDIGNIKDMKTALVDTEKFIIKKDRLYKIEKTIIELFKALIKKKVDANAIKKTFIKVKEKLMLSKKEKYAANFDEFDHFLWWVEGKIGGKTMTELAKACLQTK